jgi:delta8-fatty-acid desaturase
MRFYAKLGAWYFLLLLSSLFLSLACSSTSSHMAGAALLGLFWQQMAGLGHDLGHTGVSHVFHKDMWFGATVMNALMGISTGEQRGEGRV